MRSLYRALLVVLVLAASAALFAAPTPPTHSLTSVPRAAARSAVSTPVTPTATLSWTAPTLRTDGSTITGSLNYNVYVGNAGAEAKVASLTTSNTGEVVSLPNAAGSTVCFYVTAAETGGLESAPSNEGCKTFPQASPLSPTLTVS